MSLHRQRLERKFPERRQQILDLLEFCAKTGEGFHFSSTEVTQLCDDLIKLPELSGREFWNGFSLSFERDSRESTARFIRDFVGWQQECESYSLVAQLRRVLSFWRRIF